MSEEKKTYLLGEIEEILAELEPNIDAEGHMIELADDMILELDYAPGVLIPFMGLVLKIGAVYVKDEKTGQMELDFDGTVIFDYNDGHPNFKDYLYYEQDGFVLTIYNYTQATGIKLPDGISSPELLPCILL